MGLFSESFWDEMLTASNGPDCLHHTANEGRKMLKDIEEFYRQRAFIEDTYGKSITKLTRSFSGRGGYGSLGATWTKVRAETEEMAQSHIQLAVMLNLEFSRISKFREDKKEKQRQVEEDVKASQNNTKYLVKRLLDHKKQYESRCRESDLMSDTLRDKGTAGSGKELDKLVLKAKKAMLAAEQADQVYKSTVEIAERAVFNWVELWQNSCNEYQSFEEDRIDIVRQSLWNYTNICSVTILRNDCLCETMREAIETVDIDSDILEFVKHNTTGIQRPEPLQYEKYSPPHTGAGGTNSISQYNNNTTTIHLSTSTLNIRDLPTIPTTTLTQPQSPGDDQYAALNFKTGDNSTTDT